MERLHDSKLKKYIYRHNNNTKINIICIRLRTEIKIGGNLYIDFSTETWTYRSKLEIQQRQRKAELEANLANKTVVVVVVVVFFFSYLRVNEVKRDTRDRAEFSFDQHCSEAACCRLANRPFARWRHFTTTTRILFAFSFIFKFRNPARFK